MNFHFFWNKERTRSTRKKSLPTFLVFGYPSELPQVGGLVWSKKVCDGIHDRASTIVSIKKVSNERSIKRKINGPFIRNIIPCLLGDFCDAIDGFSTRPDIALLDSWGESNIMLWILLRIFRPRTKIITVFHHYEPRIPLKNITGKGSDMVKVLAGWYNLFIDRLTAAMIRNSDQVLTVSRTSALHLKKIYGIGDDNNNNSINNININNKCKNNNHSSTHHTKIRIVGAGIDRFTLLYHDAAKKDIDFLCIGRIEKLEGIDVIWKVIKKVYPKARLVMIGRISQNERKRLEDIGIEHRGLISDPDKIMLYSRTRVFLFPSIVEGFGIAVGEALYAGIITVVWKLPVFEELYLKTPLATSGKIRFVEKIGDYNAFAKEAVNALLCIKEQEEKGKNENEDKGSKNQQHMITSGYTLLESEDRKKEGMMSSVITSNNLNENSAVQILSWDDVVDRVITVIEELLISGNRNKNT